MNRPKRNTMQPKAFVSGGIYDPKQQFAEKEAPPPPKLQCLTKFDPSSVDQKKDEKKLDLNDTGNDVNIDDDGGEGGTDGGGDGVTSGEPATERKGGYFKKVFGNRKKPSIRAKEKKIRQNRRLRKVLLPKNALMALHEVKNIKIEDFVIQNGTGGGFIAAVTVNNVQYDGKGNSKNAAKNNACEKALRDLVISKMNQKPAKINNSDMKTDENEEGGVVADEDVKMKDVSTEEEDDELPMLNLASFALFKLFSEWEADGFEIPEFRPHFNANSNGNNSDGGGGAEKAEKAEKSKKPTRNELPANWSTIHPATLLCMMRPGITYTDEGSEGSPPNIIQKVGVAVDGETFLGVGRSKKIARKNAAVNACNKLYGTDFTQFVN